MEWTALGKRAGYCSVGLDVPREAGKVAGRALEAGLLENRRRHRDNLKLYFDCRGLRFGRCLVLQLSIGRYFLIGLYVLDESFFTHHHSACLQYPGASLVHQQPKLVRQGSCTSAAPLLRSH